MEKTLNDININNAIESLTSELEKQKLSSKEVKRYCLMAEEILLIYRDKFGCDNSFELSAKKTFGKFRIEIRVFSLSFDYRDDTETLDEEEAAKDKLYKRISQSDLINSWNYRKNCNVINIIPLKKNRVPELVKILIAAVAAIGLFYLLKVLPASVNEAVSDVVIPDLNSLLSAILKMIAGALIFFTIITSIMGFSDLKALSKTCKTLFSRIILNLLFMVLLSAAILVVSFNFGEASSNMNFKELFELFVGFVPTEFFSSFINGDMIKISVLAFAIAIAMMVLNQQKGVLGKIAEDLRQIASLAMELFVKIIPLFVFVSIFSVFNSTEVSDLKKIIPAILLGIGFNIIMILIEAGEVCLLHKISFIQYLKTSMPGTLMAFSTCSSLASMPQNKNDLKKLGVEESYINLMLPLEQVFYKPFTIPTIFACLFAVYSIFDLRLSVSSIICFIVVSLIISFACPSVPFAMVSCLTMLGTQLMLPEGAMGIMLLVYFVINYFSTALAAFSFHTEVTGLAYRNGKIIKNQ